MLPPSTDFRYAVETWPSICSSKCPVVYGRFVAGVDRSRIPELMGGPQLIAFFIRSLAPGSPRRGAHPQVSCGQRIPQGETGVRTPVISGYCVAVVTKAVSGRLEIRHEPCRIGDQ